MCDGIQPVCGVTFKAILRTLDEMRKEQAERMAEMRASIDNLYKTVLGNGDPSNSMASRLTRAETRIDEGQGATDRFWKVASVIIACVAVAIAWLK